VSGTRSFCAPALDTVRVTTSVRLPAQCDPSRWENRSYHVPGGRLVERYDLRRDVLPPSLKHVRLQAYPHTGVVTLEASLPRCAFGHNLCLAYDVPAVIARLDRDVIAWSFRPSRTRVRSLGEWTVQRADIAFDFCPIRVAFRHALRGLLAVQPSHGLSTTKINEETIYFHNGGKRRRFEITIYDKAAQAARVHPAHAHLSAGKIRIELRLKGRDVVRGAFQLTDAAQLADVTLAERLGSVFLRKLTLLNVRPGLESIITGRDELARRLDARRARRLWPYVELRAHLPRWEVCARLGISQCTGRRYEGELREARLYPAAVSVPGIVEELVAQIQQSTTTNGNAVSATMVSNNGG
jgi:hypothetical protein